MNEEQTHGRYTIGQFSRIVRISPRMLRHYDSHGILTPAEVDDVTGYRYYTLAQARDATRVRRYRDAGLPVSAMASLARDTQPDVVRATLAAHHKTLIEADRELQKQLELVQEIMDNPLGEVTSVCTARITTIPARTVAAVRATIDSYPDEGRLFAQLMPAISASGLTPDGIGGTTYHDEEFRDHGIDVEVWVPLAGRAAAGRRDGFEVKELPEQRVVATTVLGPYLHAIPAGYENIASHLAEQVLTPRGPSFVRFLNDCTTVAEAAIETEICVPIACEQAGEGRASTGLPFGAFRTGA